MGVKILKREALGTSLRSLHNAYLQRPVPLPFGREILCVSRPLMLFGLQLKTQNPRIRILLKIRGHHKTSIQWLITIATACILTARFSDLKVTFSNPLVPWNFPKNTVWRKQSSFLVTTWPRNEEARLSKMLFISRALYQLFSTNGWWQLEDWACTERKNTIPFSLSRPRALPPRELWGTAFRLFSDRSAELTKWIAALAITTRMGNIGPRSSLFSISKDIKSCSD